MIINIKHKIIICWLMLLAGMILHFNYHVSGIFYGIDVKKPGADGTVPDTLLLIRTVFYHLPFIYILLIMYTDKILWAITFLVISIIYLLANLLHVVKEILKSEDYSQIMLLSVVFVVSVFLVKENYNWVKSYKKTE